MKEAFLKSKLSKSDLEDVLKRLQLNDQKMTSFSQFSNAEEENFNKRNNLLESTSKEDDKKLVAEANMNQESKCIKENFTDVDKNKKENDCNNEENEDCDEDSAESTFIADALTNN